MKRIAYILYLLLPISLLNSCFPEGNVESTHKITYDAQSLIMGYGEISFDELTITTAPQIDIEENLTDLTLKITINSLYYPGRGSVSMESQPLKYSSSQTSSGNISVKIDLPAVNFGNYVLEDFSLTTVQSWMSIRFIYEGINYVINTSSISRDNTTLGNIVIYDGVTSIFNSTGQNFSVNSVKYGFNMNSTNLSNLYMYYIQLSEDMDPINLLVQNLDFVMETDGYRITSSENITPKEIVNGGLLDGSEYTIANFKAYIPYSGQNGSLSFEFVEKNLTVNVRNVGIADLTQNL